MTDISFKAMPWREKFPEFGRLIRCGVCDSCHEHLTKQGGRWVATGRCIYGGPYAGYQMPDGRVEART